MRRGAENEPKARAPPDSPKRETFAGVRGLLPSPERSTVRF